MKKEKNVKFLLNNMSKWNGRTPCFVINENELVDNIKELKTQLKGEIAYSHKTNPAPAVAM